jgi:hypothetical protein
LAGTTTFEHTAAQTASAGCSDVALLASFQKRAKLTSHEYTVNQNAHRRLGDYGGYKGRDRTVGSRSLFSAKNDGWHLVVFRFNCGGKMVGSPDFDQPVIPGVEPTARLFTC